MSLRILPLADGRSWNIKAEDETAGVFVERMGRIMGLEPCAASSAPEAGSFASEVLRIRSSASDRAVQSSMPAAVLAIRKGDSAVCEIAADCVDEDAAISQLKQVATLFGVGAQLSGGALVHGALAVRRDEGGRSRAVILAAPGGTGKSTASSRLSPPWESLCDDTTLVLRDGAGRYWAQPWPTWSRFLWGGSGGRWETGKAVQLGAIFFLEQAPRDSARSLGTGSATASLVASIEQASRLMTRGLHDTLARSLRLEWLDVAAAASKALPCFHLGLTMTGRFWEEIEAQPW